MMSMNLFMYLIILSLKSKYFFSSHFKIELFELLIFTIPIFSSILIFLMIFKNYFFFEKSSSIMIFFIFFTFNLCISSTSIFNFLFFLELCSYFMIFLVLNMSKDYDKYTSVLFMIIFNMLGSLPMFYIYFFTTKSELSMIFTSFFSSSIFYFVLMIFILVSKLPMFFFHFWLTKAHVSASGACSMILAGMMLKLGSFGLYKFSSIFMKISLKLNIKILSLSILSMMIMSILMIRFFDLKHFVACSSVIHMALSLPLLTMGLKSGLTSSMMMMIGHGLVSFFLFFLVSLIYEFSNNRSFDFSKSLESSTKLMSFLFFLFFFLNMGVPPLLNFYSEVFSFFF